MGIAKIHPPVKYFAAVCFVRDIDLESILSRLESMYGHTDLRSPVFEFDLFTDYYSPEMGAHLKKIFVSFEPPHPAEQLVEFKLQSNRLEEEYALENGKRRINIDPGYLTEAKVVLATTKDYSHRLYLGKGIFGDVHLHYQNRHYQAQPWTYPDYNQPLAREFFDSVRKRYREQKRQ